MDETQPGIEAEELIAAALTAGYTVTRDQLRRWHLKGLLPRPVQGSGRGRARGRPSIYPDEAAAQLVSLCELKLAKGFDFADCGWWLWWRGFSVDEQYWRIRLAKSFERLDAIRQALLETTTSKATGPDVSDWILDHAQQLKSARNVPQAFRRIRKRLNEDQLVTFLLILIQLATGEFEGWSSWEERRSDGSWDDQDAVLDEGIVVKGLGLERARSDALAGTRPWLPPGFSTENVLAAVSKFAGNTDLVATVMQRDVVSIERLRDEFAALARAMQLASGPLERVLGRNAFGFRPYLNLVSDADTEASVANFAAFCISKNFETSDLEVQKRREHAASAQSMAAAFEQLMEIAKTDPDLGAILTPRALRRALRSRAAYDQLQIDLKNAIDRRAHR